MAIPADLRTTTEQHLLDLISTEVREGKSIEYKRDINVEKSEQKQRFIRTIVSFANASGGDVLYGMEATDGKPIKVHALLDFDPDQSVLQLRDILRAHVEPTLFGVEFQPVKMQNGWALLIRVPRSWNPPHMVKLEDNRFWTRNEGGRVQMTLPEIRDSFLSAKTVKDRIQEYRFERLNAIRSHDLPFKIPPQALEVFHVLPFRSFTDDSQVDLSILKGDALYPPSQWQSCGPRHDIDGIYGSETRQDGTCGNYIFFSRTGCIEILTTEELPSFTGKFIANPSLEDGLIKLLRRCVGLLRTLSAEPPVACTLSLLDVAGYVLYSGPMSRLSYSGSRPIQRRDLLLPVTVMNSFDDPPVKVLKPIFDALWNSCGLGRSFNFSEDGTWAPRSWN